MPILQTQAVSFGPQVVPAVKTTIRKDKTKKHIKNVAKIARGLIKAQNADKENYCPYDPSLDVTLKKKNQIKDSPNNQQCLNIFDSQS